MKPQRTNRTLPGCFAGRSPLTYRLYLPLLLTLVAGQGLACGPDFPLQLTDNRAQSLSQLPEPLFAIQLKVLALSEPVFTIPAQTFMDRYDYQQDRLISATEQAEQQLLSPADAALVARLRQQHSAAAALQLGTALTAELRLYTSAAVAMANGDDPTAEQLFRQVLALPIAEQQQRRSFALYSLARLLQRQGQSPATTEALTLLQQLREEVVAGLPDPLQLGPASLGETARILKQQGDWQQAIGLYASQASYSESGRASLLQLSRVLLAMPDQQLQALVLQHSKVAGLLSQYLLSQYSGLSYADPSQVSRLLRLLAADPQRKLANATELAAIYYQQGDFALASALLAQATDSPLRWWLTAKLAVQANDLAAAAAAYAKAAAAFPTSLPPPALSTDRFAEVSVAEQQRQAEVANQCRVQAEAGVLHLQRGDYLAALQLLYQSGAEYWQDTAYIAERVLTSNELQQFVDLQVPPGQPKAPSDWNYFGDTEPNTLLRQLLARKLMREQRFAAALPYFVDPALRQLASQYLDAYQQNKPTWFSRIGQSLGLNFGHLAQAEARFTLARLTRQHGLELLGFEMAPDYQVFYGQYEFWQPEKPPVLPWPVPAAEQQRVSASSAVPDKRFHYRYLAAELASQTADLLPANSQAFAASLCHATTWVIHRDPAEAQRYYQRYLQQGPYVPWGADFGSRCPAPDFAAAASRLQHNTRQQWSQLLPPRWVAVTALVAGLALGLLGWHRRRQNRREAS
jgi:hypothetical protein